jgi:predicted metal-dependent phosphoesterase TrpH
MAKADLHMHTTASDGKFSPTEVVEMAAEKKLETIAITDHDTYKGYFEARSKADDLEIEVIPGIEITSSYKSREVHILAYCFDVTNLEFKKLVQSHRLARLRRAQWIIQHLKKQGLTLTLDEVRAEAGFGNVGRPHIARVLIEKGYVANFREAFMRYLSDQNLKKMETFYVSYADVIAKVKAAGGASVLAHPGLTFTDQDLETFVDAGLDGIECIHPSHNYTLQKHFAQYAEHHNLLRTGGSDFHGSKRDIEQQLGIITVSMDWVRAIKRMTKQRKQFLTTTSQ